MATQIHLLEAIHKHREGDASACAGNQDKPNRVTMEIEEVTCDQCSEWYWNQGLMLSPSGQALLDSLATSVCE